jgi:sortase A
MRKLGVMLIIIGVMVALYPMGERAYSGYRQRNLLAKLELALADSAIELDVDSEVLQENAEAEKIDDLTDYSCAIGILVIEKIDLRIPVMRGINNQNLRVGAALLEGSAQIGVEGNTALAAHRSHTYGHLFNRLNELEVGDRIEIVTQDGVYGYSVDSNSVVGAEDVSVLSAEKGKRILTLITCHPLNQKDPQYRIVVQASMVGD